MTMSLLSRAAAVGRAVVKTCGHAVAVVILVSASAIVLAVELGAKLTAFYIAKVAGAVIDQDVTTVHKERFKTFQLPPGASGGKAHVDVAEPHFLLSYKPGTGGNGNAKQEPMQVLDEARTLQKVKEYYAKQGITASSFPSFGDAAKMTGLAQAFISSEFGCLEPDLLADDFQFLFPVVGPLTKTEFVEAFSSFKLRDSFPNSRANFYNFQVDPLEPNRLWALSRGMLTQEHRGPLFPAPKSIEEQRNGNAQLNLPPQCFSFSFNEKGQVYKMTGGYCVDRAAGDTHGLGGLFGVLEAAGTNRIPMREGHPWNWWTRSMMWEALSLRVPQIIKEWRNALSPVQAPLRV